MNVHSRKEKGFTLIELLVVVAIIGLLASVVLASLNSARAKARDAQRAESIHSVQNALELYYNANGFYPSTGNVSVPLDTALAAPLTPTYIGKIPVDPSSRLYKYYSVAISASIPAGSYYAILIPYEAQPTTPNGCYVCGGAYCQDGTGWWGVNMCK